MGNHGLEHHQSQVNTTPPIVLKAAIVETQRQHARIGVIHSLDEGITTTWVETVVVPNINVVRRWVLIGFTTKLGNELGGVLIGRNLNRSSVLPIAITRVLGITQMVFTNLIMATHVNRTTYLPLMNSMATRGYRSANVMHPRGGCWKPFVVTAPIFLSQR